MKERNDKIFNDCVNDVDEIFDSIKVLYWYWSLNRLKIGVLCIMGGAFGVLFLIDSAVLF